MTLSEQYMASHYSEARALFGPILPAAPTWGEDLLPGSANAEAKLQDDKPHFAWRTGYPSDALDPVLRASEIKRTSRHEIGHPFEFLLAKAFQKKHSSTYEEALAYVRKRYFTFREFSGNWTTWEADGRQPREGFADCFGAALGGEWLVAVGSSQADRHLYGGMTVSWQRAREFFLAITQEATATPAPQPPPGGPMKVVDLRSQLPLAWQYLPQPATAAKISNTVHWTGGHDTVTTDEEAIVAIKRWHQEHINKDWSSEVGIQHGAGIMYLEVIAPSGTVFITRDPNAVTWHCSSAVGNAHSRAILVICDADALPTAAQLASLEERLTFDEVYPHRYWVGTQCPGPQLLAYLDERGDDDMFTQEDRDKLNRMYALANAEGPRIWTQRLQDWLSKLFKSIPFIASAGDFKGPDVTSGQPRS